MDDKVIIEMFKSSVDMTSLIYKFYNQVICLIAKQAVGDLDKFINDVKDIHIPLDNEKYRPGIEAIQKDFFQTLESIIQK